MTRTLKQVSQDLKRLAPGRSPGERALQQLAAQLEGPDSSALADIDLATAYSPPMLLDQAASWRRRAVSGFELLRDVLIFVPVIYTWWKISQALAAYGRYTGEEPFLLAWQHGFGEQTQPLSASALVVSGVVLGVIVLTIVAHAARAWTDRHVHQRQRRLAVLLAEASVLLSQSLLGQAAEVTRRELASIGSKIATSTSSLQEALTKASGDIVNAVDTGPTGKLHEMFVNWTAAANQLTELGARLKGTHELVERLQEVSATAQRVSEETSRLLVAFESERTLSRQEAHAHHELASEVGQSTRVLGESLQGLNERAEQFNELILRLAYIVDRMETDDGQPALGGYGR